MKRFALLFVAGIAAVAVVNMLPAFLPKAMAQAAPGSGDPALAQTPLPDLVKMLPMGAVAKPFVLAVALGSPPDDFRDDKGEIAGWEIDIMRAATQALGLQLDVRPTTFDTLIPGLQANRFDAATGQLGVTVVREKVVDMIGTLLGNELFVALIDSSIAVGRCSTAPAPMRSSRR